jgi:hypothetical protein
MLITKQELIDSLRITANKCKTSLSLQPRGLRRRSATAGLVMWVRILLRAWTFVCCECCVLSGRGLHAGLIARPEELYRLWCVVVCDLETSRMRRLWPALDRGATENIQLVAFKLSLAALLTCGSPDTLQSL